MLVFDLKSWLLFLARQAPNYFSSLFESSSYIIQFLLNFTEPQYLFLFVITTLANQVGSVIRAIGVAPVVLTLRRVLEQNFVFFCVGGFVSMESVQNKKLARKGCFG